MTFQDLGSIGELVGAIAVVVSVAYLAFQIHQNTDQLRRAEVDAMFERFFNLRRSIYESSDLSRIWVEGGRAPEKLDEYELARYYSIMDGFLTTSLQIYGKSQRGALDPGAWETTKKFLATILDCPGGKKWWLEGTQSIFPPDFQEEIELLTGQCSA